MKFSTVAFVMASFGAANAHFRLNYPGPRGAFVADKEPEYCGGYTDVTTNRTTFPLSNGFFKIETGHPGWTAAVIISTAENPNSFDLFSKDGERQFVRQFAKEDDAGAFCIPLNISAANIEGVRDGSNVTIQVVFDGGDGALYQCADLTLSANLTEVSPDSTCTNATSDGHHHNDDDDDHNHDDDKSGALSLLHGSAVYTSLALGVMGAVVALLAYLRLEALFDNVQLTAQKSRNEETIMRSSVVLLACFLTLVTAHFQLQFPPPRGPFVEDDETNFCVFPLSGGFITLTSEHPSWTVGFQIATADDPNTFDDFQLVNNFAEVKGEGAFCLPLDFKSSNATGLTNNQNITIMIIFSGGDGNLFQCADLMLSDSEKISSDVTCSNGTSSSSGPNSGTNPSSTGTSGSSTPSPTSHALPISSLNLAILSILSAVIVLTFL
ncbi:Copper acquisition factor BIM1 [Psilocybe cubensis]|uniref:Copper acquisition factor BIM1 n=1 Tax=Psilocybe cubensis TaxID=181762 RepID=A0ACB8HHJ5_PSICU|nr:Copper acquisition factor BIM1 [Psilocybe cubensis]KAH9487152.1 Copper acquisition factor BIM1 [Psilocybe cubensis]